MDSVQVLAHLALRAAGGERHAWVQHFDPATAATAWPPRLSNNFVRSAVPLRA